MTNRKPLDGESLMTREEAADALRVSMSTVDRYIKTGVLRSSKVGARLVRVHRSSVEEFLDPDLTPASGAIAGGGGASSSAA